MEIIRAMDIEYGVNPENEELRSSSNSLKARTEACIAPIPKPRVHPKGGEALRATFLGLPRRNSTNADSAIAIRSAYDPAVTIFTCSVIMPDRINVSAADASSIPETMPKRRYFTDPERSKNPVIRAIDPRQPAKTPIIPMAKASWVCQSPVAMWCHGTGHLSPSASDNVQTTLSGPVTMALDGLKRKILGSAGLLRGKRDVDEETLKELSKSLRRALLEADFNVRQTKELTEKVERRVMEEDPSPGTKLETHAMNIIYTELVRLLGPPRDIRPHNETILMVGLYGQGKTTTTAKVADWWRKRHGVRVSVIEADTHRPGAYEQLCQLLEGTGVEVYGEPGEGDASKIVRNGLKKFNNSDVVIIDTAGRDSLDDSLRDELVSIAEIANATERFLVIDAQVGQAAGPVAETFHNLVGVTGTIVTKLDGTARGGGALSAVSATGAPIVFVGEGERIQDLEKFESDRFISRLLGMGDIKGLIDLTPEDLDQDEAIRITQRMMSGRFTLTDMYSQMEMMSKIGTMDKLLSHLPDSMFGGMGNLSRGQKKQMQSNLEKFRIIMDSMTQHEKDEPLVLKSSRIRRIARGSGVREKDVKELLAQWNRSKKMMRGMKGDRRFRKQMQSMMDLDDVDLGMG